MRAFLYFLVGLLVCLCLAGCGGGSTRDLPRGQVKGKVTYKGEPLTQGSVVFMHPSGDTAAGVLGPDGTYTAEVAIGENKVLVQSREPEQFNETAAKGTPKGMPGRSRIPERYSRFETSNLTLDVKEGENPFNLELSE